MDVSPCFGRRWYHRRLRHIDRMTMAHALVQAARKSRGTRIEHSFRELWNIFIHDIGQEHWRCTCAEQDQHTHVAALWMETMERQA